MASEILGMIIDIKAFSNEMARATPMPISLKEAYYEYRYGISTARKASADWSKVLSHGSLPRW